MALPLYALVDCKRNTEDNKHESCQFLEFAFNDTSYSEFNEFLVRSEQMVNGNPHIDC
jgi:hypothetical protein